MDVKEEGCVSIQEKLIEKFIGQFLPEFFDKGVEECYFLIWSLCTYFEISKIPLLNICIILLSYYSFVSVGKIIQKYFVSILGEGEILLYLMKN